MTIKLPDSFFFGAVMVEPQTNINKCLYSNLDMYLEQEINVLDNNRGLDIENNTYQEYEDKIRFLKSMNFKSITISIQWIKLLDRNGNIKTEGAAWYHQLIDCANKNEIDLFLNIYHYDMPEYLIKRGGWQNREVVEAYANFVKKAFEEFGQKVKYWFISNGPVIKSEQQFLCGIWYPYLKDFKQSINVQYNITLAHCLAIMNFRKLKKEGKIIKEAKIGANNCFIPVYTKDNPTPEDLGAVKMIDGLYNRWWLDIAAHGHLPNDILDTIKNDWKVSINCRPGDEAILAYGKVDLLGFNYYQPTRVQAPDSNFDGNGLPCIARAYIWSERKMSINCDHEIYPKAIYDFGMKIKMECPNLPFYIFEKGIKIEEEEKFIDDAKDVQDDYWIEYIREHLEWTAKAIEDGVDCLGYHFWITLEKDWKRVERKSTEWIKEVARTNQFE